jgi:hypothetical protein
LEELMRGMTNREYRTRLAWLEKQWNEPDRTDHYLMMIANEVRNVLNKKKPVDLKPWRIPFKWQPKKPERTGPFTQEEKDRATRIAVARWSGIVGGNVTGNPNG